MIKNNFKLENIHFRDLLHRKGKIVNLKDITKKDISYPINISYNDNSILLEISALGIKKEDIKIITQGDILTISYTKLKNEEESYIHKGITNKSFKFELYLYPEIWDLEQILAVVELGVLHICISPIHRLVKNKIKIL